AALLQTLNIITLAYQNVTSGGLIREPNETIRDHLLIIEAICSHDAEQAEHLMRAHLRNAIVTLQTRAVDHDKEGTIPGGAQKRKKTAFV
ncbi:MAG: FCD domain-containing protein, partial [Desulfofustis sp.]|nr:FCD domain-containing protein [Desulfofustis sp.]